MSASNTRWSVVWGNDESSAATIDAFLEDLRTQDPVAYIELRDVHIPAIENVGPLVGGPVLSQEAPGWYVIRWQGNRYYSIYCQLTPDNVFVMQRARAKLWPASFFTLK
jgi:hypothetical protein